MILNLCSQVPVFCWPLKNSLFFERTEIKELNFWHSHFNHLFVGMFHNVSFVTENIMKSDEKG